MRHVVFRGKTIDTAEWVYGNLIQNGNKSYIGGMPELSNDYGDGTDFYLTEWNEVHPETVGQKTDLTEKDGVGIIYEDDVISRIEPYVPRKRIVIFKDGMFKGLNFERPNQDHYFIKVPDNYGMSFPINLPEQWEIVGNIHDNPELLKEEVNAIV